MEPEEPPRAGHRIVLRPAALRFVEKLRDEKLGRRLEDAFDKLAQEPRPPLAKLLANRDGIWRVRVGDYRVLYQIDDGESVVRILEIGHRREIYRG